MRTPYVFTGDKIQMRVVSLADLANMIEDAKTQGYSAPEEELTHAKAQLSYHGYAATLWFVYAGAVDTAAGEASSRDLFRREFLGRPVVPRLEDVHPFPWTVRRHSDFRGGMSLYVWIVLDARSKCVAECESQIAAEAIASLPALAARDAAQKKIQKLIEDLTTSHMSAEDVKKIQDQYAACVAASTGVWRTYGGEPAELNAARNAPPTAEPSPKK